MRTRLLRQGVVLAMLTVALAACLPPTGGGHPGAPVTVQESEPNNDAASANNVPPSPSKLAGDVNRVDDSDFLSYLAPGKGTLTITLTCLTNWDSTNNTSLLDIADTTIEVGCDRGGPAVATVGTIPVTQRGHVTFEVTEGAAGPTPRPYTVEIAFTRW